MWSTVWGSRLRAWVKGSVPARRRRPRRGYSPRLDVLEERVLLTNPVAVIDGDASIDFGMYAYVDGYSSTDDMMIMSYDWDLDGDGNYDDHMGESPMLDWYTIESHGGVAGSNYTIGLEVTDDEGNKGTDTWTIALGLPQDPVAVITGDTEVSYMGSVMLDGGDSFDQDEWGMTIDSYDWDLDDDGSFDDASGSSIMVGWDEFVDTYGVTPGNSVTVELQVTDNEGQTAVKAVTIEVKKPHKLIIKVDQPGAGGDRDYIEGFDVGHAFLTLVKPDGTEVTWGFYPGTPGDVVDDTGHGFEVSKSWNICDCDYDYLVSNIAADDADPPTYDLLSYNCVDWVLGQAASVGIYITTVLRATPAGMAHNAGDFGEDLKLLP